MISGLHFCQVEHTLYSCSPRSASKSAATPDPAACLQDWTAILKRLSSSVSQAAVLLEDLTESVAAAAVEGASKVSKGRQGGDVGPQVAVELVWRLQHLGLSDDSQAVKVSAQRAARLGAWNEHAPSLWGHLEAGKAQKLGQHENAGITHACPDAGDCLLT